VGAEHQALLDAVLNRDIQAAQALIAEHLQTTGRLLMAALQASPRADK
jgi:DNA-binding GntR family transcriptional regulator